MELFLGYITVVFTIYRMVSYQLHQRRLAAETRNSIQSVHDVASSRLFELLYTAVYGTAAYGVFIGHTPGGFIIVGLACMVVSWMLRQRALKDLAKNYGHEIVLLKKHRLIQHGVYNSMRHPLYLGLCIDMFGAALMAQNLLGWCIWILFLLAEFRRISLEDTALREKFGEEALRYQKRVPAFRLWPRGILPFYK